MAWRDVLNSSYRPRPLHTTVSSRECVTLRSSYTPSVPVSSSVTSSRMPSALRRRASEVSVKSSLPTSFAVSSYSRWRPSGGTQFDLPSVDPSDLPRRYRSDRELLLKPSRDEPKSYYSRIRTNVDTEKSYRKVEKVAETSGNYRLIKTKETEKTDFVMVVMKKEITRVQAEFRELRMLKAPKVRESLKVVKEVKAARTKEVPRVEDKDVKLTSSSMDSSESVTMELVKPSTSTHVESPKKKVIIKKRIIKKVKKELPYLPDTVLTKIFSTMTYKELCAAEVICQRWQRIIIDLMRREVQEITLERLGSSQIKVVHQPQFRRLNITCPSQSYPFLSGVLRRCRTAALRITTDMHFLSHIDRLTLDRRSNRKYFGNIDELWIVIVSASEDEAEQFEKNAKNLFNYLGCATLQIHAQQGTTQWIARCVNALIRSHSDVEISMEIHADSAALMYDQLEAFSDLSLYKLKLICTEFELPELELIKVADILKRRCIRTKIFTLRDWSLLCDASTLLTSHPLQTLRLSSCDIFTAEDFLQSLIATEKQDAPVAQKVRVASKEDLKSSKKRTLPFIKRLEIAGHCRLRGLEFLTNKAHKELEKKLSVHFPQMDFDYSEIYYFE